MKQYFRIASVAACLYLCLVITMLQVSATDVSSAALSLDLAAGSVEIYESEGITYCVQTGVTQTTTGGVIIRQTDSNLKSTTNSVTISSGSCKLTISNLNIEATRYNSAILIKHNSAVEMTLVGSNKAKGGSYCAAIAVPLTLDGSGSLAANGGGAGAGIGGGSSTDGGTITINGGTITATSGSHAAGIGGGSDSDGGTITINGGTIIATVGPESGGLGSGHAGAGIGGGHYGAASSITINGGTVTAIGGYGGAGIGIGYEGHDGNITINGGTVTAIGGNRAVDIGADAIVIAEGASVINENGDKPNVRETIFISGQPLTAAAHLGNTPVLDVTAHNHSSLTYQWQVSSDKTNWTNLEGETSPKITFSMSEDLVGSYLRCQLTNGWGNVEYTDAAQIYILAFKQQPTSMEANLNDVVVFEATSTCSNVTYQWQRSYDDGAIWSNVPNETYSTLIVSTTLTESSALYRCVITATNGDQLASEVVSVNLDLGELVTYTVQDYLQNADSDGYTMTSQQVLEGISGETINASTDGYDGFTLNTGKGVLSGTVAANNSLVLTRYFDRKTYSITFDTNGGGTLPKLNALYGAPIEAPTTPSRYGYVFEGWYVDEDLTEEYVFDTMPLNGTTVYAKWTPVGVDRCIEYTINGLTVRDSSTYEVLNGIPDDDFLVEVSVTNLEATETDTILLVCYTDQGQMVGMNYMFTNIPVGYTATLGALVDNNDGEIGIVKAFVLPTLGNPTPLAEAKAIEKMI